METFAFNTLFSKFTFILMIKIFIKNTRKYYKYVRNMKIKVWTVENLICCGERGCPTVQGQTEQRFFCVIEQHSAHGPFDIEDIEDLGHSQERAASPRPDLDQHVAEALGPLLPKDELPPKIFGRRGDKASSSVITASQMVI